MGVPGMSLSKSQLLGLLGILIALFFLLGWHEYLSLTNLKQQHEAIMAYQSANPKLSILFYSLIYIVVTGLSLPGATILTLAGGAFFGLFWGTVIVSIASTIGATAAFLAARYLFRGSLEQQFATQLAAINKGIEKDGGYYLFTLRLVPLFPFFAINLLMGLTKMETGTFFWVSQVGMLAGTIVYVNAGTQLGAIQSLADISSPALIGSFILLGLFPLAAKKYVEYRDHARNQT
jgi:uncharacterized membrane protein YdjX (TVP38/TMEM64 family)